jgi:phenylacetate-CoA ligase
MYRRDLETAPRQVIRQRQLLLLNQLLDRILPRNRFYAAKLGNVKLPVTWESFAALPFTTKAELVDDQEGAPPFGGIATYGGDAYVTYHQTSGTKGRPMAVFDTVDSWRWWAECWQYVYAAAGVTKGDRIFFAFSFGPFIGFWSAYEGARRLGACTIPAGGLDTRGRLSLLRSAGSTVLLSTVSYALRLAEVARAEGIALRDLGIRSTIHAGEPGASIPAIRARVEDAWGGRCFDHAGATEVGAYAYTCAAREGLHVNEAEFIAEALDPDTGQPVADGQIGELVITNLGRDGWPALRYRTGDLVKAGGHACACGRTFQLFPGGLQGRIDDLIVVRGINIYPSAIEAIVRAFDVAEFRIVRYQREQMDEVGLEVEASSETAARLALTLRERLGIRVDVTPVPHESLPRFELKARRVVDRRGDA